MTRPDKKPDKVSIKMVATFLSIFVLAAPVEAFFRLLCFNPLGFGRIDPIMSPGKPSTHLHHLHGSGNLGIDSTDANYLLEANCTSCSITVDKSSYWAPAMYFEHEDGTLDLLNTSSAITIYYKTEKRVNYLDQNYTAFPNGLRMVSGDSSRRNWVGPWPVPPQSNWGPEDTSQLALSAKVLGFNCLNYVTGPAEATFAYPYLRNKTFIDAQCVDGVRAEVMFPSCWDGVNLDSPDHRSHVAIPTLLQDGSCPATHPVFLPILFYETIWNTFDFAGIPGRFVFSNGDPTGYGYHGDFIAAWEEGVLERVMANPDCTDQDIFHRHVDGLQQDCPVFAANIQSQEEAATCKLQVPELLVHETFKGPFNALPGNVMITGDRHDPGTVPEDYPSGVMPLNASIPAAPPVASAASSVRPPSASAPVGPTASTSSPISITSTANVAVTTSVTPVISTTSYVSNGIYYEVDVVVSMITAYETVVPTSTVTVGANAHTRRHVHGHKHHDIV